MSHLPPPPPVTPYATPDTPTAAKHGRGLFGWVLFVGVAIMLFLLLRVQHQDRLTINISQFRGFCQSEVVSVVDFADDELHVTFAGPQTVNGKTATQAVVPLPPGMADWQMVEWIEQTSPGVGIGTARTSNLFVDILIPLIPWVLIFLFIWFFVFRQLRKNAAGQHQQPIPVVVVNPPQHPAPPSGA